MRKLIGFCGFFLALGIVQSGLARSEMAGVFMTLVDREGILLAVKEGKEPWKGQYASLMQRADGALKSKADPFRMEDVTQIRFGWCQKVEGEDDTLKELSDKLDKQSGAMRDLALAYSFSGKRRYAVKAEELMLAWVERSTLLNLYDLGIDFRKSSFDGMSDDGYCGARPWNMALDTMWQTYGLINVSDAYVLLKGQDYSFGDGNEEWIEAWIRSLAEAVNSGFHAWTRWADAHTSSSSFVRYRSDNHLSWCLAGLLAGAVALEDDALARYVLEGGVWHDSKAGDYANPSSVRALIDVAIEGDAGGDASGRIYEEKIKRKPPVGYSFFHVWALSLVASVAEKAYGEALWDYKGSDGAGLREAYVRYAEYSLGRRESPKPEEEGAWLGHSWLYEFAVDAWPDEPLFREVRDAGNREKYLRQSIGPIALLYGRD